MLAKASETVLQTITQSIYTEDIQKEFFRKSIHLSVAFIPFLASINLGLTMGFLAAGTIVYAYSEILRIEGHTIAVISAVTMIASRKRDSGRIVLGPITLAVGTMISLLMYPNPASAIAIYALAFGDGFSSIIGKTLGTIRLPFTNGKTLEGSLACFIAVFLASLSASGSAEIAFPIALSATLIEALPLKDMDNIVMPVSVGFLAEQLLPLA